MTNRHASVKTLLLLTAIPAVTYRVIEALLSASILNLLGYFTIQSNLAVIVVVLFGMQVPRSIQLTVASAISVTAIVFQLFLRGFLELNWVTSLVTNINHGSTTILYLLWFFGQREHPPLKWKSLPLTLIYPALYCIFSVVENLLTGQARYFFFDFDKVGLRGFLLWFFLLALLFALIGWSLVLIDHRLTARREKTA